jgi:ribosomal protein L16/L10AE
MKFIALKTAKITAKKRASFHKKQRRAESEIRASYIFRRKFLAKKFKISDIRILKIALKRICNLTTPLSKKGILTRMGKGKGKITGWVSWVRPGVSLVEFPNYPLERKQPDLAYLPKNISRIGQGRPRKHNKWIETRMRIAQSKLPFKCKISKLGFSLNYQLKTQIKIL